MKILSTLIQAWKNRETLGDKTKSRELSAFLPAALEIQETPPNPLFRILARALILLLVLGVAWACFGKVNIVASAEGKIIPISRVKQIQPLQKAIVKEILVQEGQEVLRGQPLIVLDAVQAESDQDKVESEILAFNAQKEINVILMQLFSLDIQKIETVTEQYIENRISIAVASEKRAIIKELTWQKWQHYKWQLLAYLSSIEKNQAEALAISASIKKLELTLPIVTKRTKNSKDLFDQNLVSEVEYLELEQERIQQEQDLESERQNLKVLNSAREEIEQQINAYKAQNQSETLSEISEYDRQLSILNEELVKAEDINKNSVLYAPVSGKVQELVINTEGGVVTDAQQLMVIVPKGEKLEVEVQLENKDIGFVEVGQKAEVKIHTFPFTKYGLINGEVKNISNDAVVDENQGLVFKMLVQLESNSINVDGKEVALVPGMAVTSEVNIGKRRVIEFFLAPLLKSKNESIRER